MFDDAALASIIREEWHALGNRFAGIRLDKFVIMPNHLHFIVWLVGAPLAGAHDGATEQDATPGVDQSDADAPSSTAVTSADDRTPRAPARGAPTLGTVVGTYKSLVASRWLAWVKDNRPLDLARIWQRNFHDHVIRNEDELNRIREYIRLNPLRWLLDAENPHRKLDAAYEKEWGWLEARPVTPHPL